MEVIINSFLLVALTEMGDKTQLLAFVLASKFRKPWTVLAGITVATILNHALAAGLGAWLSQWIEPHLLKWILGSIFIAFALWILIPDKDESDLNAYPYGAFFTTLVTFFLAEMGDKTQLSTVALAANYQQLIAVTFGTTLGMIFSDGLAVFLGDQFSHKIPLKWVRIGAAALFVVFGVGVIWF